MVLTSYYLDRLEGMPRESYVALFRAVLARQSQPNVGRINIRDFERVYLGVSLDHPELCYFSGVHARLRSDGVATIPYLDVDEDYFTARVNDAVADIYAVTHGDPDDYVKAKAIFDWISTHVEYDFDLLDEYARTTQSQNEEAMFEFCTTRTLPFTPYGVFVYHKAVCNGIAKAYKLLCDLFGVDCMCVRCFQKTASGEKGTPHLLNVVKVHGADYYVCPTSGLQTKGFAMTNYGFFLCDKATIDLAYVFDEEIPADPGPDDYFRKRDIRFDSTRTLRRYLAGYDARRGEHQIRFRYAGGDLEDDELSDFALEILNRHAPAGTQWLSACHSGSFNAMLCDRLEILKFEKARKAQ